MTEEEVLAFVGATIKSIWALELLLLLRRNAGQAWTRDRLVRELRGSAVAIEEALASLGTAGLIAENEDRTFRYAPASEQLNVFVSEAADLYAAKPVLIIRCIAADPNEKLRIFSDAFRFKE